jgi:autotransporter passenger strand-loop-strand repeat protein
VASSTVVQAGGLQLVYGDASGTTINRGGEQFVFAGGSTEGTLINGGTVDIMSGSSVGGSTITFASSAGGVLELDSSLAFTGLVAGFSKPDEVDLRDIGFVSGTTHATWTQKTTSSGVLAVTGGGSDIARLRLLGQYVTANFLVASDKHGGTVVTDPPVSASQNVALVNPHT